MINTLILQEFLWLPCSLIFYFIIFFFFGGRGTKAKLGFILDHFFRINKIIIVDRV